MAYYFILGIVISLVSSFLGAFSGGGAALIMLPLLIFFAKGSYISLLALTKLAMTIMTLVSTRIHLKRHSFDLRLFIIISFFGLLGTAFGTYLVQFEFNEEIIHKILGAILLVVACYFIFAEKSGLIIFHRTKFYFYDYVITAFYSLFLNIINGMMGGTGIFMTMYLVLFLRMTMIHAIAYAMLSYAIINSIQTGYLLSTVDINIKLAIPIVLGSYLGAFFGTHFQYLKGNLWVKYASAIIMIGMGLKMLF